MPLPGPSRRKPNGVNEPDAGTHTIAARLFGMIAYGMEAQTTTCIASLSCLCYNGRLEVHTVRFGKKTRNLAAAGRRFFGERATNDTPSPLAPAPTPEDTYDEEMVMTPPAPEESMVAGDPTQRLLTSLGRFQRQVNRAEEGAPQENWCDECMNQLIVGIEIALNEGWADVKEALTDTARVLQTYEDAGMAADCVAFLKDSYEILCLMVGDLIVDNVRSGVMKKWHERYERALNDLATLGLTLVDDESTRDRESQGDDVEDLTRHEFETPDPFAQEAAPEPAPKPAGANGSAFDELIGGGAGTFGESTPLDQVSDEMPAHDVDPFSDPPESPSPFGTVADEAHDEELTAAPKLDEFVGQADAPTGEADYSLSNDFTADEPADTPDAPSIFDAEESPATPATAAEDELFGTAFGGEQDEAVEAPVAEEPSVESATDPVEETPIDEAPADEAPVEETPVESAPAAELPVEEITPEPVVEEAAPVAPAPPAEPEPEPGTPEALWKTAQQAMALGNVSDAKVFALQLAANMARLEAEQVAAKAQDIKAQIDANVEEVTHAEQAVSDAEERLRALEEQIAQSQQDFDGKREHVQQLREEVAGVEGAVADLDRQIAELEARREEERQRLAERQTTLDDTLAEESRMQAEIDALQEEEGGARENLDSARERVEKLHARGGTHEADLEAIHKELANRESSVADIEKTIALMGGGEPPAEDGPETPESEASDSGEHHDGHDEHGE